MGLVALGNGQLVNLASIYDFLEVVQEHLGYEMGNFFENYIKKCEEDVEYAKYEAKEAEDDYERYCDAQHSMMCDIREDAESLLNMLCAKRIDRKKLEDAARRIWETLNDKL